MTILPLARPGPIGVRELMLRMERSTAELRRRAGVVEMEAPARLLGRLAAEKPLAGQAGSWEKWRAELKR